MAIGNEWLGSLNVGIIQNSQNLATNSMVQNTPIISAGSVVDYVAISLNQAMTENVYVSLMPSAGAGFTAEMYQTTTSGKSAIFYRPEGRPIYLGAADRIQVRVTNTQVSGYAYMYIMQLS